MYFSRIKIEADAHTQGEILKELQGDMYSTHQLMWRLFPNDPGGQRDFLFRQEFEKEQVSLGDIRRGMPIFYMVSPRPPTPIPNFLRVEAKPYLPKLETGMHLGFELRANPIVARSVKDKKHSVKHDVMMDAKYQAKEKGITEQAELKDIMEKAAVHWLISKGEKSGFKIANSAVIVDRKAIEVGSYQKHFLRKRGGREICFSTVDFSGVLEVTDPAIFLYTLCTGIGHSRSFGCGMLMIRPIC